MTKQLSRILWPALTVAALAMSVPAQAADIRCRVPFDFTVKGRALAAGTYELSEDRGVLIVRGAQSGAIVMTTRLSAKESRPRLVFDRYGDQYVLRQVWTGSAGGQLTPSRHELELAQKARQGGIANAERVEIPVL